MSQFLYEAGWIKRLADEVAALKAQVNAVITQNAELRTVGDGTGAAGVPVTHPHSGTGTGGILGSAAFFASIADPGDGNAIAVTASGYVPLVTGGAETRTLAAPTFVGQEIVLYMKTSGGNCTVTIATTINETGNNTIIFANTGEAVRLFAVEEGATIRWRMATADGAGLSTV